MKKITTLGCFFMFSLFTYSQTGINTVKPQGVLHVDGAKDNPTTGVLPTENEQLNDFIVTNTGNVGIGTTTPTEKVDIKGNVQFTGTLNPNGSAGTMGQVLTSQGTTSPPVWITTNVIPVVATVKSSLSLNFLNNVRTPLEFNIIEQDTFSGVKLITTPIGNDNQEDRIVIAQDGDYLIQCQFGFAGGQITNNGIAVILIKETDGTDTDLQIMQAPAAGGNNTYVNLVGVHNLKKNDNLMLSGQQSNGNTRSWTPSYFRFSVAKM